MTAAPSPSRPPLGLLPLLGIGSLAGVYSGLFGVGGGTIIVPLLMLVLAFDARVAVGTSLAAITVIATAGAITHAIYGNVHYDAALIVAIPAVIGALVGTALQQRVSKDWLTIGLALFMIFAAVNLLSGS